MVLRPLNVQSNEDSSRSEVSQLKVKEKRQIIRPMNLSQSVLYQSLTPNSTLNEEFQGLTIPLGSEEGNVVILEEVPHKILDSNKELIPL